MKPIAINGRFLTQPITGVQRHARELIFTLDAMLASGELQRPDKPVDMLVPRALQEEPLLRYFNLRKVGRGSGQLWEQLELPAFCRGKVLLTPCGGAPLLHRHHVFILPDAGVFATPQSYARGYGAWYRWHHRRAARLPSLQMITVSDFSRAELARHLRLDPARIIVIPLGHEHALRPQRQPEILGKLSVNSGEYVLTVGSANPNKNLLGLLQAFTMLTSNLPRFAKHLRLVIAGSASSPIFGGNRVQIRNVTQTGYVTEGELRSLYENAACFVLPSFYEGFGLPMLEAMALGVPAVVSRAASLPAVAGDAAVFFNPGSPLEMAQAIASVLTNAELRDHLSKKGKCRAGRFQWRKTARETWSILLESAA